MFRKRNILRAVAELVGSIANVGLRPGTEDAARIRPELGSPNVGDLTRRRLHWWKL